jgi:hypothetical protein
MWILLTLHEVYLYYIYLPVYNIISSTNKTDCHDMTEILSKVALNTIKQTNLSYIYLP